jgi:hypothetical protein
MYSKMELCFAAILTLLVFWHSGSQKIPVWTVPNGPVLITVADGGHPPPPPTPPFPSAPNAGGLGLRADGGHPPPPPVPWVSSLSQAG